MHIGSQAFAHHSYIPSLYTCQGEGICPPLEFSEVPVDAVSLVLIIDDPDAVSGLFTHWVLFNIPPHTTFIDNNAIPEGAVKGMTSGNKTNFFPPCPPKGTGVHHYRFKLFALSKKLSLQEGATVEEIIENMQGTTMAQTELVGLFGE